ncbi:hypothetical protein M8J75_003850 [Diaphorina citri]|nr:hypothetical protein M8J75_003850 [Diaphorina citri]
MTSPPILLNAYNHDGENGISTNLYGKKTAGEVKEKEEQEDNDEKEVEEGEASRTSLKFQVRVVRHETFIVV